MAAVVAVCALTLTAFTGARAVAAPDPVSEGSTVTAAPAPPPLLTQDQALARARRTHAPVNVSAAETPTTTLTASPDGTFTLTVTAQPVRTLAGGTWRPLDATLHRNADGSVSPAATTTPLTLSGGGTGPLATMRSGLDSLSLALPAQLPVPVLAGSTATYQNVLPGTDLVVTADTQGGFSDVLVIRDAAAAASPKLAALLTATMTARGLTVAAGSHGEVTARDARGTVVFGAPSPRLWDSATATGAPGSPVSRSTVRAPGAHAHVGPLGARIAGRALTLAPDSGVLHGPGTVFPVFIDPSWTGGKAAWSTPSQNYPTDLHWNSSAEGQGLMQVGEAPGGFRADTLINFALPLSTLGAEGTRDDIQHATLYMTNVAANNCTAQTVDVYAPSATLNSGNATWNNWFTASRSLGGAVGTATFAHGWSSSCPAASVGFPLSTGWISGDVAAGKATQTLALAGTSYSAEQFTGNGAGQNDYEVFAPSTSNPVTPALTITYAHAPATPAALYTTPSAATIGKGDVSLNVPVYDPDGGTLSATITATGTATGKTIASATMSAGSGTTAVLRIPEATLNSDVTSSAFGGTAASTTLGVSWSATVSNGDGSFGTVTSAVKKFTYDMSTPGAPDIYLDSGRTVPCTVTDPTSSYTYTVGTPADLYLAPAPGQPAPSGYTYQLNDGEPVSVPASGGDATASITPTAQANILTVYALSAGGNIGQQQRCVIIAAAAATEADGDVTGDGNADLLIPGTGTAALPAGLWLAPGTSGGAVSATAVNIGLKGTGVSTTQSPAQWTGTQVITGQFQDQGFNGVLDYNPSPDGTGACSGQLLSTFGQALPLDPISGTASDVTSGTFTYLKYDQATGQDDLPACATSAASGGNLDYAEYGATSVVTSYGPAAYPDLLVVVNGSLYLEPTAGVTGGWDLLGSTDNPTSLDLSDTSPSGSGTWDGWKITTTLVNDIPAMFATSPAGAVYYYSPAALADLAYAVINNNGSPVSGAAGPVRVDPAGFATAGYAQVSAAGFGAGSLGVWGVAPDGTVTPYQLSADGTSLAAASSNPVRLVTSAHDWPLNDQQAGPVGTAADQAAGGLPLKGSGGASWSADDAYFAPDVTLNGTSGDLATSAAAIGLTKSFTVSAWASPAGASGSQTLLSQDGPAYPGLQLGTAGTAWTFGLNTGPGSGNIFDTVTGGTVDPGQWTQVTASYDAGSAVMSLYVDGILVKYAHHGAPAAGPAGPFHVGSAQSGASRQQFFGGQVAQVQAWSQAVMPSATPSATSYHYSIAPTRVMDTRTGLGGTTGPVASNSVTRLKVAGAAGGGIPQAGVTAVAMDLTVTGATAPGNVVIYADGDQRPATSTVQIGPGFTATNYEIVPVSRDGYLDMSLQSAGTAQLVVDATGYYDSTLATGAQTYQPVAATRLLDTRYGQGAPQAQLTDGSTLTLPVAGTSLVPASAAAVAVNLTATREKGSGYLEAYAAGTSVTPTTALSYGTSPVASFAGDVPVGPGGKIAITNHGGPTDLIADITGYYLPGVSGDVFHAITPERMVDTRTGVGGTASAVSANTAYTISGSSVLQITTAASPVLALNITVTQPAAGGNLVAYPYSPAGSRPGTSNLNWDTGVTVANSALVPGGPGGDISAYNGSPGSVQLVVDCSGFFAGS